MVTVAAVRRMNMAVMGFGGVRIYIDDNMTMAIAISLMRTGIPILYVGIPCHVHHSNPLRMR
jgi:ribosomal protein L19E